MNPDQEERGAVSDPAPLSLFSAFGIELEYMLVDVDTLDVRPVADVLLAELGGPGASEADCGPVAWSNELARHVIELKTNGPVASLAGVPAAFSRAIEDLEVAAAKHNVRLMPTGMHPWMDPDREFVLWPSDPERIYGTFNRIFDCRGHGWSNLQSMHVNLPFANDREFCQLHAAVRFLLPLLPALSASSPVVEGRYAANLDQRLDVYRNNARLVPEVSGAVVPESARSRAEYEAHILGRIYQALEPHDPEGVLREEWVNARGAIARFDRMAIEIRVLDAQESPRADLATAHLIVETLRPGTVSGYFVDLDARFTAERLAAILQTVIHDGERAVISDVEFLRVWGFEREQRLSVQDIWSELLGRIPAERRIPALFADAQITVAHGCLARRIRETLGEAPTRRQLTATYRELCDCLRESRRFLPR
jgi:glutamate---cysteine ligase / carboxylate-amine ligase